MSNFIVLALALATSPVAERVLGDESFRSLGPVHATFIKGGEVGTVSGVSQTYLDGLEENAARWLIPTTGDHVDIEGWGPQDGLPSADGKSLLYIASNELVTLDVSSGENRRRGPLKKDVKGIHGVNADLSRALVSVKVGGRDGGPDTYSGFGFVDVATGKLTCVLDLGADRWFVRPVAAPGLTGFLVNSYSYAENGKAWLGLVDDQCKVRFRVNKQTHEFLAFGFAHQGRPWVSLENGIFWLDRKSGKMSAMVSLPPKVAPTRDPAVFEQKTGRMALALDNGHLTVWSVDGKVLHQRNEPRARPVAFYPDGKRVLVARQDRKKIDDLFVWHLETDRIEGRTTHQAIVRDLMFSADGKRLASVGLEGELHVFRVDTGASLHSFSKRDGHFHRLVRFFKDEVVVTGGVYTERPGATWSFVDQHDITRVRLKRGTMKTVLKTPRTDHTPYSHARHRKGHLWVHHDTGSIARLDAGKPSSRHRRRFGWVKRMRKYDQFSIVDFDVAGGKPVALTSDGYLQAHGQACRVWAGKLLHGNSFLDAYDQYAYWVRALKNGDVLVNHDHLGVVRLKDGRLVRQYGPVMEGFSSRYMTAPFVVSPDEKHLLVVYKFDFEHRRLALFDVATASLLGHAPLSHGVSAAAFSPDGQRLALGFGDGTIEVHRIDKLFKDNRIVLGSEMSPGRVPSLWLEDKIEFRWNRDGWSTSRRKSHKKKPSTYRTISNPIGNKLTSVGKVGDWVCGLRRDGQVRCADLHLSKKSRRKLGKAKSLAVNDSHLLLLRPNGVVDRVEAPVQSLDRKPGKPTPVRGAERVSSLAVHYAQSCGLRDDGAVVCWTPGSLEAKRIGGLPRIVDLQGGGARHCAQSAEGGVYCWGYPRGNLGDANRSDGKAPVEVKLPAKARSLQVLGDAACAWLEDGSVWCWGRMSRNASGPLLAPHGERFVPEPVKVEGLPGTHVVPGARDVCEGPERQRCVLLGSVADREKPPRIGESLGCR